MRCVLVVLALQRPVQMGVYVENELVYSVYSTQGTSVALASLFAQVSRWLACAGCALRAIYYATGPGSFTAMKLTHVFVHTLAITKGLRLYGALGFVFNAYRPIKAFGKSYYLYHRGQIVLRPLENPEVRAMRLPVLLDPSLFSAESKPLYLLSPV
ncbi:hypothetical protein [Helicobacter salomonis]|uniref:hypothetical protein n=1 Tax=Helicobacter salomonis TaxID=56878 RepID=UPI0013159F3C|nr:hypothetical protein [Helicobacter salomonis]